MTFRFDDKRPTKRPSRERSVYTIFSTYAAWLGLREKATDCVYVRKHANSVHVVCIFVFVHIVCVYMNAELRSQLGEAKVFCVWL